MKAYKRLIPYGRQWVSREDITAVSHVLSSDWLTQGPKIKEFEGQFADYCGVKYAVAVANGTCALHLACLAAGIKPGDNVIAPAMTFVASVNCILYCGGMPVLADIRHDTHNIDVKEVKKKLGNKIKAIIAVDFSGHPCDLKELKAFARSYDILLIEDAAHALGARYRGKKIGSISDMTIFSFHPVKAITSGEGGMVTTNSERLYERLLLLRSHGITRESKKFVNRNLAFSSVEKPNPWYYEMQELGYNFRITDFQCALGINQLKKVDKFISIRREIAERYNNAFKEMDEIEIPVEEKEFFSAWHLYVIELNLKRVKVDRAEVFFKLRESGLGVNVHYIPVHMQPYYQKMFGYKSEDFPNAEEYYQRCITLPIFPRMKENEIKRVISVVKKTLREFSNERT